MDCRISLLNKVLCWILEKILAGKAVFNLTIKNNFLNLNNMMVKLLNQLFFTTSHVNMTYIHICHYILVISQLVLILSVSKILNSMSFSAMKSNGNKFNLKWCLKVLTTIKLGKNLNANNNFQYINFLHKHKNA